MTVHLVLQLTCGKGVLKTTENHLKTKKARSIKVRQQKSKIKIMLIAFFDSKGLIHHEFVPPGQTVNMVFYLQVIKRLSHRIRRIRSEYKNPGTWHDNATAHLVNLLKQFFVINQITAISKLLIISLNKYSDHVKKQTK